MDIHVICNSRNFQRKMSDTWDLEETHVLYIEKPSLN